MNTEPGFECPECATKLFGKMRCPLCGWHAKREDEAPKLSCWTCDACHSRSPGQPVIAQPDGPHGALRGLCSACHFDLRIKPTVRATPEEVRANLEQIRRLTDRVTERIAL